MRRFTAFLCSLMILLVLAGCGGKTAPQASDSTNSTAPSGTKETAAPATATDKVEGKLVIYTSVYQEAIDLMTPALKAKFPNLEVTWVRDGTEKLIDKLSAEFAAGSPQADAIMMADPAYARLLKSQGLLMKHVPAGVEKVQVDRDPEGYYTGVRVIDVVIIYNPDLVKPEEAPKNFRDLLDPKWKGQVAMPDPTKSGSTFATVGALVQRYGWEYFEKAQANQWQVGGSSSGAPTKVYDGKAKVGLALEQQYRLALAEGKKVGMVWPEDGAIVLESPYAILKDAKNPVAAKAVSDWLITPEAQIAMTKAQMHPVIPGVAAPAGSYSLEEVLKRAMKVDWVKLAEEKGVIQDRFVQTVKITG